MGQKVNPFGFRLGYIKKWHSTWYSKDKYADTLHEDLSIRAYIEKKMKNAKIKFAKGPPKTIKAL